MKQDLSIGAVGKELARLLLRFHVITYAVIVATGLSVTIFFVSQTILAGSEPPANTESVRAGFDQETIKQLESLSQRSKNGEPLVFPSGQRINPFSE